MDSTKKYSGPSEICCLCRRRVPSYNNPDPLMDGTEDCCDECNQLVKAARRKIFYMEESKRNAYEQKLRTLSYEELKKGTAIKQESASLLRDAFLWKKKSENNSHF